MATKKEKQKKVLEFKEAIKNETTLDLMRERIGAGLETVKDPVTLTVKIKGQKVSIKNDKAIDVIAATFGLMYSGQKLLDEIPSSVEDDKALMHGIVEILYNGHEKGKSTEEEKKPIEGKEEKE